MNSKLMYNHGKKKKGTDTHYSPLWVIDRLPEIFNGNDFFDPCPGRQDNHVRATVGTPRISDPFRTNTIKNALAYSWQDIAPYSYVNPPFSKMNLWIDKATTESKRGHHSLWFTKLDFRTQWGEKLVSNSQFIYINLGYTRYLKKDGSQNGSATFQTGFCLFSNDSIVSDTIALNLIKIYGDRLWYGNE
jgi:DNA N-6-adenine-methyltransferase (Dam)